MKYRHCAQPYPVTPDPRRRVITARRLHRQEQNRRQAAPSAAAPPAGIARTRPSTNRSVSGMCGQCPRRFIPYINQIDLPTRCRNRGIWHSRTRVPLPGGQLLDPGLAPAGSPSCGPMTAEQGPVTSLFGVPARTRSHPDCRKTALIRLLDTPGLQRLYDSRRAVSALVLGPPVIMSLIERLDMINSAWPRAPASPDDACCSRWASHVTGGRRDL